MGNMKLRIVMALTVMATVCAACHHDTLEDRAEKETREYTEKNCPTPYTNDSRTDSISFTRATRTIHCYYTVKGKTDNAEVFTEKSDTLRKVLLQNLKDNTQNRAFKKEGFAFHYVFRSATSGKTLLDVTFTKKDYDGKALQKKH